MDKVSVQVVTSYIESKRADEYSELIVGEGDSAFTVKLLERPLTADERMAFIRSINKSCIVDGISIPEIQEDVFKCAVIHMMTNLPTITKKDVNGEECIDLDAMAEMHDLIIDDLAYADKGKHLGFFANTGEMYGLANLVRRCEFEDSVKHLATTIDLLIDTMSGELSDTDMSQLVAAVSDSYGALFAERAGDQS